MNGVWLVFQSENGYLHLPSEKYKTSKAPHIQIREFHTVIYKFCSWSDLKTENDICVGGPNIMRTVQTILELSATNNPAAFTHGLVRLTSVTRKYYVTVTFKLSLSTPFYTGLFLNK